MSNKGLAFVIFILIVLCVGTFGAFYLKIHPENSLSQKIFGVSVASAPDNTIAPAPVSGVPGTDANASTGAIDSAVIQGAITPKAPAGANNNDSAISASDLSAFQNAGASNSSSYNYNSNSSGSSSSGSSSSSSAASNTSSSNTSMPSAGAKITQTLKKGSTGSEVKILQQFLISNSYLTGTADGSFGAKTATAVMAFQKDYKLTQDGVVGSGARKVINELLSSSSQ